MARSRKSSAIEDLIELASLLPWKISILMAVISYIGLHYLATVPNIAPTDINQMGAYAGKQVYITISMVMQYVVPIAFLIGAGLSVYKQRHRIQLLDNQSGIESIRAMSWQSFELLVGEAFRRQGYAVNERGGNGPDGGVDLVLHKEGRKVVVQCKRWKSYSINVSLARELYGVMVAEDANECIFVTCGIYTLDAIDFAKGKPIQLIDGDALVKMIREVQPESPVRVVQAEDSFSGPLACPKCGSPMVRRIARKGINSGNRFWGCSKYPGCRGVIN